MLVPKQAGSVSPLQQGRSAHNTCAPSQANWSLSPSLGASGASVEDAASSPDSTPGITGEQEQRPGGQGAQAPPAGTSPVHAL